MKDFLNKEIAGLPNWAWLLVVGAGILAAYFVPKFLGGMSTTAPDAASTNPGTGNSSNALGLAIDPTTGLPYAVEGLVPQGAVGGSTNADITNMEALLQQILNNQNRQPPPAPGPPPIVTPPAPGPGPVPNPPPPPNVIFRPKQPLPQYFIVQNHWPKPLSTLSEIAAANRISLARIEQLNPQITNPDLIFVGERIRIS